MKSYPFRFLLNLTLLLSLSAFVADITHVSPFLFPFLPFFFVFVSYEKNQTRRIATTIIAVALYSQMTTPLPFVFLVIVSILLLISSTAVFRITSFDIEVIISLAVVANVVLLFSAYSVLIFRNTGEIPFGEVWGKVFVPSIIAIALVFFFQYPLQTIFKRDTWL